MPKRPRDASTAMADVVAKLSETNNVLVQMASEKDKEINQLRIQLGKQPTPIAAAASTFVRHEVKAKFSAYARKIDALGDRVRSLETENAAHKLQAQVIEHEKEELAGKITELETKNLNQSKIIDEKDAEARENENAMHDMYASQKLDREDIEEKERAVQGCQIIAEYELEGVKAMYTKKIDALGGKVRSLENLIEDERHVTGFFARENGVWYNDNNVLRARVTELESKLEQQADSIEDIKTQIIDQKDAEARVIMDTLHDMEARHQLDSEDIDDKFDRLYSCSIIGKHDQEKIGKLQKEIEAQKLLADAYKLKSEANRSTRIAAQTELKNKTGEYTGNVKNLELKIKQITNELEALKSQSNDSIAFTYTGELINPAKFTEIFSILKHHQNTPNPVHGFVDAIEGPMHFCKIAFSVSNSAPYYYLLLKEYCKHMVATVPAWGGMIYGSISMPNASYEWGKNIIGFKLDTLPTMTAVYPDFNWVPLHPQEDA